MIIPMPRDNHRGLTEKSIPNLSFFTGCRASHYLLSQRFSNHFEIKYFIIHNKINTHVLCKINLYNLFLSLFSKSKSNSFEKKTVKMSLIIPH